MNAGDDSALPFGFAVGPLTGGLDEIGTVDDFDGCDGIARGGFATVRGWAFDGSRDCPVEDVSISLGDGSAVVAVAGLERPDIGPRRGAASAGCGFAAALPVLAELGRHSLTLRLRSGGSEYVVQRSAAALVVPPPDPFGGSQERPGQWRCAVDGVFDSTGAPVSCGADGSFIAPDELSTELRLWVLDAACMQPAHSLAARFGGHFLRVLSTTRREDVALAERMPGAEWCGFSIPLVPAPVGTQQVFVYAFDHDGAYWPVVSIRVRRPNPLTSDVLPPTAAVFGTIDELTTSGVDALRRQTLDVAPGDIIRVRGWAVDTVGPRLSGGVEVLLDGHVVVDVQTSLARTDVAREFGSPSVVASGFDEHFALPPLAPGLHRLTVRALSSRRDARSDLGSRTLAVRSDSEAGE